MEIIKRTLTSNEVALIVNRQHDQALRDIAKIIDRLAYALCLIF